MRKKNTLYATLGRNPVHPFPARMAPDLALKFLRQQKGSIKVLDPMMGSGTVIALARSAGHRAYGVDIDPLAVLMANVWTTPIDRATATASAQEVLQRAKKLHAEVKGRNAFPRLASKATRRFIRYWFDASSRRELACLAVCIGRLRNKTIRDLLWCAFSRMIITKQVGASLAMDLAHSRPHRVYDKAPIVPFEKFLTTAKSVIDNCLDQKAPSPRGPTSSASQGDARRLGIKSRSIDLVLTSPPYLNAIDYMRCSKFSLIWMGYQLEELSHLRSTSVGAEVGSQPTDNNRYATEIIKQLKLAKILSPRNLGILTRYIEDIHASVGEVSRVLVPGGKAIYVLGENTVRGAYIPNSKILAAVATRAGLRLKDRRSRTLPANRRYLPPPISKKGKLNGRMRREVVLTFQKPKLRFTR